MKEQRFVLSKNSDVEDMDEVVNIITTECVGGSYEPDLLVVTLSNGERNTVEKNAWERAATFAKWSGKDAWWVFNLDWREKQTFEDNVYREVEKFLDEVGKGFELSAKERERTILEIVPPKK